MLFNKVPLQMFKIFDPILFKVLLLLYGIGKCDGETDEDDLEEDETCYIGIKVSQIAELTDLPYDTVVEALERLIEEGFIVITEDDDTKKDPDLIKVWTDFQEVEQLEHYDDDVRIWLYPQDQDKDDFNITEYLMDFQND